MPDAPTASPLAAALARAQGAMGGALKDRQNPHFKSSYATMASVVDAIRKPLSEAGIAYVQQCRVTGKSVIVETVLLHGSGEQLRCGELAAEARDPGPQAIGSVLTYLRRYSLMAAVGVAPEDDDGEQGVRSSPPPTSRPASTTTETPAPTTSSTWETDWPGFRSCLEPLDLSYSDLCRWLEARGKPRPSDASYTTEQRREMCAWLALGKDGPPGVDIVNAWLKKNPAPKAA